MVKTKTEPTNKSWFEIKNTSATASEIYIMGDIVDEQWVSEDVTPTWFKDELDRLKKADHIHIFVNSGGGSVFAALAIHNMIKNSKAFVTTHVMGLAASSASWMIMPSNKIVMPKNAFIMLHLPVSGVIGNKNDFIAAAEILTKVEEIITDSYLRGGKKLTKDKVTEMMNAGETWLDGQQAFDIGLIDFVEPPVAVANHGDYVVINGVKHSRDKFQNFPEVKVEDTKQYSKYQERINNALDIYSNLNLEKYNV